MTKITPDLGIAVMQQHSKYKSNHPSIIVQVIRNASDWTAEGKDTVHPYGPFAGNHGDTLRELESELFQHIIVEYPEFSESAGIQNNDGNVESFTLESFKKRKQFNDNLLTKIQSVDRTQLNWTQLVDLKILQNHVLTFIKGYQYRDWGNLSPINFLEGPLKHRSWIGRPTIPDSRKYLSRLERLPGQIEEQIKLMKRGIELNRTNHAFSMEGSLDKILSDMHYMFEIDKNTIYNSSENRSQKSLKLYLQPIFNVLFTLKDFAVKEYIPASRRDIGLSSLPGGLDYYEACLRYYLGSTYTPKLVHEIGMREVKRIEKLMKKILKQVKFKGDLQQYFKFLRSMNYLQNISKEEVVGKYNKVIKSTNARLWDVFYQFPLTPVQIVAINDKRVLSMGAYYKNRFYLNIHNLRNRSSISIMPLTFHEANPGHHFQDSYGKRQNLPSYRRHALYGRRYAVPFTYPTYMAYTEGWALYAEQLGLEMGFFKTPFQTFGKYNSEIFRACRLVVDTGIHAFGWSKQKAVDFIKRYTDLSYEQLSVEIDRYITWPGHACSYKIGEMKIKDLRRRSERLLGDRFNIKEFHHQILKIGPVSLDILDDVITDWISKPLKIGILNQEITPSIVGTQNNVQRHHSSSERLRIDAFLFFVICLLMYVLTL